MEDNEWLVRRLLAKLEVCAITNETSIHVEGW